MMEVVRMFQRSGYTLSAAIYTSVALMGPIFPDADSRWFLNGSAPWAAFHSMLISTCQLKTKARYCLERTGGPG
jgi:hypothetical protein